MSKQVDIMFKSLTMTIEALEQLTEHQAGVIEELNKVIAGLRYDDDQRVEENHVKPEKAKK